MDKNLILYGYPLEEIFGYKKEGRERFDFGINVELNLSVLLDHDKEEYCEERFRHEIETMIECLLCESDFDIIAVDTGIIHPNILTAHKGKH